MQISGKPFPSNFAKSYLYYTVTKNYSHYHLVIEKGGEFYELLKYVKKLLKVFTVACSTTYFEVMMLRYTIIIMHCMTLIDY